MGLSEYVAVRDKLTPAELQQLESASILRSAPRGTLLSGGAAGSIGLLAVRTGRLRAFVVSEKGREATLYRLFPGELCPFSASFLLAGLGFHIALEAEKDSELYILPAEAYQALLEGSALLAGYMSDLLAVRFGAVVRLMEQVLWKSFDRRLAEFLLGESLLEKTDFLKITHEKIANHMGTAREVVTRALRRFQSEGLVKLTRGGIELTNKKRLAAREA